MSIFRSMGRLLHILRIVWAVGLILLGLTIGATVGYANESWIGGVCLGATGALAGGIVGAPGGIQLVLQAVRLFDAV